MRNHAYKQVVPLTIAGNGTERRDSLTKHSNHRLSIKLDEKTIKKRISEQ